MRNNNRDFFDFVALMGFSAFTDVSLYAKIV